MSNTSRSLRLKFMSPLVSFVCTKGTVISLLHMVCNFFDYNNHQWALLSFSVLSLSLSLLSYPPSPLSFLLWDGSSEEAEDRTLCIHCFKTILDTEHRWNNSLPLYLYLSLSLLLTPLRRKFMSTLSSLFWYKLTVFSHTICGKTKLKPRTRRCIFTVSRPSSRLSADEKLFWSWQHMVLVLMFHVYPKHNLLPKWRLFFLVW